MHVKWLTWHAIASPWHASYGIATLPNSPSIGMDRVWTGYGQGMDTMNSLPCPTHPHVILPHMKALGSGFLCWGKQGVVPWQT